MSEQRTVSAEWVGNPGGGLVDNPWPDGRPLEGERVALFTYQVVSVDGAAANHSNSYHIAPISQLQEGPIGPIHHDPQGISVRWVGLGAGVVVRSVAPVGSPDHCEVAPEAARPCS